MSQHKCCVSRGVCDGVVSKGLLEGFSEPGSGSWFFLQIFRGIYNTWPISIIALLDLFCSDA